MINENAFTTLSDRVIHDIRQDILNGVFEAGQKLIINDLKSRYDVGGSPLREALVQLSWRNYLVMIPQRGFWVAEVSLAELRDIIATKASVSKIALQQAVLHADEDKWQLSVLTAFHQLDKLDVDDPTFDYDLWEVRHKHFHLALLNCTGQDYLSDMIQYIYDQQERYRHFLLNRSYLPDQQYHDDGEHELMMKAVLQKDVELAHQLLLAHSERLYALIEAIPNLPKESSRKR